MEMDRINFKRVNLPGNFYFQLKGSILLIKKDTWISRILYYVPVEILEITKFERRDIRRLWEGILGLMVAFLIFLPLSLWRPYRSLFVKDDLIWIIPLSLLFGLSLIVGIRGILLFLPNRPAIRFSFTHGIRTEKFSFWVKPNLKQQLEDLISQISTIKKYLATSDATPLKICPAWYRSKPYRKTLVIGLAVSFILFCVITVLIIIRTLLGSVEKFWLLYILLPFPPLFSILGEYIERNGLIKPIFPEIKRFRTAYENERLRELAEDLQSFIKANPDVYPARFFYIQVLTELGEFDQALKQCELLYEIDPSTVNKTKMVILEFKKVRERMELNIDKELNKPL
ncbi:MAG: hypothetical protein N3G21_04490 [Candidatus Hydrogenedentes bacterium]|nr:hypothetical protein [Candidatus Hydrogenedentota bacterium]